MTAVTVGVLAITSTAVATACTAHAGYPDGYPVFLDNDMSKLRAAQVLTFLTGEHPPSDPVLTYGSYLQLQGAV
jgi:hypothetical protein